MQKSYLFLPLILLLFSSCQAQPSTPSSQKPTWTTFWQSWQKAVAANDTASIADLIRFPLVGAEHLGKNGQFLQEHFSENYSAIIGDTAKEVIAQTSVEQLATSPMNSAILSKLTGIPMGEQLKVHKMAILQNTGTPQEKKVTVSYIFGLVNGAYRLVWLRVG